MSKLGIIVHSGGMFVGSVCSISPIRLCVQSQMSFISMCVVTSTQVAAVCVTEVYSSEANIGGDDIVYNLVLLSHLLSRLLAGFSTPWSTVCLGTWFRSSCLLYKCEPAPSFLVVHACVVAVLLSSLLYSYV
jgi:hypothetical protein